jgi:hypothetical protein
MLGGTGIVSLVISLNQVSFERAASRVAIEATFLHEHVERLADGGPAHLEARAEAVL